MQLTNLNTIKELAERHSFNFTKSLGQNFLINPTVCPKIAELGGCKKDVCAVEIGTGFGVLTKELAIRADKVLAIEIDKSLKPVLDETLSEFDNVEVLFADVMKIDLKTEIEKRFAGKEVVLCANLPYYITSPVIMKVLEENCPISKLTVMVQKEAADRICAKPGTRECGAISVAVSYHSTPKQLFKVSRGSFNPSPRVDSAVISLEINREKNINADNEKLFFEIVKVIFAQRRKQILNPLSGAFKIDKNELCKLLEINKIKPNARAEELLLSDYEKLYNIIVKKINR